MRIKGIRGEGNDRRHESVPARRDKSIPNNRRLPDRLIERRTVGKLPVYEDVTFPFQNFVSIANTPPGPATT